MSYCYENAIPHSEFLKWDPEDRAKVLAFMMEQISRCTSCGTAAWEWEQNKFAYTVTEEWCQGCYQKSVYQDTEHKGLAGTRVTLVPTTPLIKAQMTVTARKRGRMMSAKKE